MNNFAPPPETEPLEAQATSQPKVSTYPVHTTDLGGGISVERALPLRQQRLVGPWCFFDHYGPLSFSNQKAMDIAPHPHIGLQTVSWLFDGEILHSDSLGCSGMARPGELNLMTAGRAIAHAEETPARNSGKLHGLQLWVALPDAERQRQPCFDQYQDLPVIEPGGGRVHLFMGELAGQHSIARAFSPLVGAELKLGANARMRLPLNAMWEHALVVIEGEILLDGKRLVPGALHYLGTHRDGIEINTSNPAHAVLIGGAPFGESVIIWWNFVARSADEIHAAREDWEQHRRFGEVHAYKGERLKAPPFAARAIANY
jgi:quercetin 2,3-dioxygenase